MIDAKALLSDLQKLLKQLEGDIRVRCQGTPEVDRPLREQYDAAKAANRTAQAYEVWRDEQITQAAVAWVLGCVFVRFCEDNRLIDPPRLSGPEDRRRRAEDEHTLYFQQHPTHSDRDYLLWVFAEVARLPAMRELLDHRHNPLWSIQVSGDGAMALREFWGKRDAATGLLIYDFTDPAYVPDVAGTVRAPDGDDPTRFLGDLYQDLSESARKKFALLQTPIFVEEFILDRTLTPAIREFGFQHVRMIDPTCGSGHFLLGGFRRLFDLWVKHEPATNVRELAQRALGQVYGVDLNPFAIAIARFRLLLAALAACGIRRLADTPGFTLHLAAGDSLLHGPRPGRDVERATGHLWDDDELKHHYETEDADLLRSILGRQYHAVVGNPPYIVVRDKALNDAYRTRFRSCHRQYSLAVPFFERFVDLTLGGASPDRPRDEPAGFFGMITANSFMKREFGKKLIERFIPTWDVSHVIDTSGAYIPGHGTPTVILFGRHRRPAAGTVRTAMGITGEPTTPDDPARGLVWTSITTQIDQPGSQSRFVSVGDTDRSGFHKHPWSIGGGGASELKEILDEGAMAKMGHRCDSIGFVCITKADEFFQQPLEGMRRKRLEQKFVKPFGIGEEVRDWTAVDGDGVIFPYDEQIRTASLDAMPMVAREAWVVKTELGNRAVFGGQTYFEAGKPWYEYGQIPVDRLRTPLSIVFGFVATHNHFVLDRGGKVFKQSAPVIKLPADATEDDHLALLGLLNSSTACFWMQQVFHNKGRPGADSAGADERYEMRYEHDSTKLLSFPLPASRPLSLARRLDELARAYAGWLPEAVCRRAVPTAAALAEARERVDALRGRMIALQEELDWACYRLYGLLGEDSGTISGASVELPGASGHNGGTPAIALGQRAFEIVLARQVAAGEVETTWFERHGSTPITEIPADWPEDYRRLVQRRIDAIAADKNIALIERPEYKRRWNTEPWDAMHEQALRSWLLDRLEGWPLADEGPNGPRSVIWDEREPRLMSVAQLADRVRREPGFMDVAALYRGREDFDLTKLVAELVEDESVPLLPVLRYKESGLRNRRVWEQVWDLQRHEDAIDARTKLSPTDPQHLTEQRAKAEKKAKVGDIPVPPKYKSADMASGTIWRLRGKLDVPKERFGSFPHCQRDGDDSLVIAWAGFDHLQQMQALAAYYMDMKEREGWTPERRVPLLAGMLELLPWVLQWHNAVHPDYGVGMGDYYRDFIDDETKEIGKTLELIKAWTPPSVTRSRGSRANRTS